MLALAAIVAGGAAFRFATLGTQSFSGDEGVTVALVELGLGDMLDTIPDTESTPPLYYVLAWLWAQVFGTGEVGIRSLSALLGTLTIPVAYAAAARLVSHRAGLAAAALTAVSPLLVWYSQEARSYALLVLLAALSLLFLARALEEERHGPLVWWAVVSALALATHYYAAFLVVPEAVWLVAASRRRVPAVIAASAVVAVGLALLPLALDQRDTGNFTSFIEDISLSQRLKEVPKKFLGGEQGTPGDYGALVEALIPLAALLAAGALVLLVTRGNPQERRGALLAGGLAAVAVGVPVAMALAGFDYFAAYLLIAAWVPAAVAVAAGFGAERAGRLGVTGAAALTLVFAAASVAGVVEEDLQRPDYEAAAKALGEPDAPRALVATPDNSPAPLRAYGRDLQALPGGGAPVSEIVLLGMASEDESTRRRPGADARRPPAPGFRLVELREADRFTLARFGSPRPVRVTREQLAASALGEGDPAITVEAPR
jgi:4-amino-4-deoxy-L-arabinose transferase-like glycosyltransferase